MNADKYLEATPGSQESTVSTQQQMEGPGPVAVAVPPETDDDSDVKIVNVTNAVNVWRIFREHNPRGYCPVPVIAQEIRDKVARRKIISSSTPITESCFDGTTRYWFRLSETIIRVSPIDTGHKLLLYKDERSGDNVICFLC